ncbi:putative membrane protein [Corynebacterium ulcerans BR-AD22]|nr:putative membrane protein [Corynebacterium ulcerans BR-AD22]
MHSESYWSWAFLGVELSSMTHLVKRDRRLQESPATKHPWWKVMCLTGVDYYSTLGYQPGIAVVAAGALAPIATLVLVAVTMLGAVPVYRRIARESPDGQGSIAVLSHFVHGWKGKFLILVLLGFAATDFTITMTLSASDATAHLLHTTSSPWTIPLTIAMLASLALVFYRGFTEAIRVSVVLVSVYLVLTAIIVTTGLIRIGLHPSMVGGLVAFCDRRASTSAGHHPRGAAGFPQTRIGPLRL